MNALFSFDGRIRRQGFWIASIVLNVRIFMVYGMLGYCTAQYDPNMAAVLVLGVTLVIQLIIGLSLSVRHWHDLNKSGWWVLITLIPIVGAIYTFVQLGFMPGDQGANQYGPVPVEGQLLSPSRPEAVA